MDLIRQLISEFRNSDALIDLLISISISLGLDRNNCGVWLKTGHFKFLDTTTSFRRRRVGLHSTWFTITDPQCCEKSVFSNNAVLSANAIKSTCGSVVASSDNLMASSMFGMILRDAEAT